EAAYLTLVRFYQQFEAPLQASQCFLDVSSSARRIRRTLKEAYLQAEAAIRLWYRKYPPSVCATHIDAANTLLREALADRYVTARSVVALAFVDAIKNEPHKSDVA